MRGFAQAPRFVNIVVKRMISHHHKTIFVHIPKCAGQSIESAFLMDLGLSWEDRAPLLLRKNDNPNLGPPRLAHLLGSDYVDLCYIPLEMFEAYNRFAVVRNPWSRAVSMYSYLGPDISFRDFVCSWLPSQFNSRDRHGSYWFVRPQAHFIFKGDTLLIKDIVSFERLDIDFAAVAAKCGLASPLPFVNRSRSIEELRRSSAASHWPKMKFESHPCWFDYYTMETAARIGSLYAEDVEKLGYLFDDSHR